MNNKVHLVYFPTLWYSQSNLITVIKARIQNEEYQNVNNVVDAKQLSTIFCIDYLR